MTARRDINLAFSVFFFKHVVGPPQVESVTFVLDPSHCEGVAPDVGLYSGLVG